MKKTTMCLETDPNPTHRCSKMNSRFKKKKKMKTLQLQFTFLVKGWLDSAFFLTATYCKS